MNSKINTKILVDTCFLISLVNSGEELHENAKAYFKHFVESKSTLLLSTISLSEFYEKQSELNILENFQIASFGIGEAKVQHQYFAKDDVKSTTGSTKSAVKDDIKIISTGLAYGVDSVLSVNDDFNTLAIKHSLNVINYSDSLTVYLGKLF